MTVHVSTINTSCGAQIGCLALSAPERINAQNLAMVRQMAAALAAWEHDAQLVAIVLIGAGERGFCAGGDLKALYHAMTSAGAIGEGDAFFAEEYRLCQTIREYPKPVLAWGHGIVMGGGWGLFSAASHRIVTPTSRLAMPETGIGLFPDVAASWWLPQMGSAGRFLALSGAAMNAADALALGAAQWLLPDERRHQTLLELAGLDWQGDTADHQRLAQYLSSIAVPSCAIEPQLLSHQGEFELAASGGYLSAVQYLKDLAGHTCDYLGHVAQRMHKASPTSLYLSWRLQDICADKTLAETVALETQMAACALRYGDFQAGIYATLFDRNQPHRWREASIESLDLAAIEQAFAPVFE
ncbi:enoyl-CoA hydratase/isomerase family protein [Chitinibacter bivalviorum]|uniref:3-hydroxyisobutyryl-CoA hydrolase n=1 Tax=Chitinibacter bivalviorum TaxID=2739434 RepID=A0A7H9BHZ9_9NEIS|nr:enoyl-CoA hydratase/isomerase family protein [Chitinibacter bivalviorum]QLG88245.1 enoyl-CoA hydratase/isomerase family protein [Chitinibacter bivalviorum]